MIKKIILAIALLATQLQASTYAKGDCVRLIDVDGKGNPEDIMKVTDIIEDQYIYRWWLYQKVWAPTDTLSKFGSKITFEKFTIKTTCPK